jgi:SAM-dependent methyltransferase
MDSRDNSYLHLRRLSWDGRQVKNPDPKERTSEWTGFSAGESSAIACQPWRAYCDRLHWRLMQRWVGGSHFRRALKTDLFDESVGEGCCGALAKIADGVEGIDISAEVVQSASRRNPAMKLSVGDVRSLDFADASFDLVLSNSTLDHFATVQEIEQSIGEIARVLDENAILILTLDNPWNPIVALRNTLPQNLTRRAGLIPYFMGRTLSMRALIRAVEKAGLRVQRRSYIQHAPRVAALHLCRLLGKQGRLQSSLVATMLAMETLSRWPTAAITGHYSALLAKKPGDPQSRAAFSGTKHG